MKIVIQVDPEAVVMELMQKALSSFSGVHTIYHEDTNVEQPFQVDQHLNGSVQQTVDEARQVTEVADANVDIDSVMNEVKALLPQVEEQGLRTRREIKQMLVDRGAQKFTDLNMTDLCAIRDELQQLVASMED